MKPIVRYGRQRSIKPLIYGVLSNESLITYFCIIIVMEATKHDVSKGANESAKGKDEEAISEWTQLLSQLVDKLTGKDLAITYEFDGLEIEVPKATGPGGKEIGSAMWKIDGKIVISTEVQDKRKNYE